MQALSNTGRIHIVMAATMLDTLAEQARQVNPRTRYVADVIIFEVTYIPTYAGSLL
jgi:hypothetical protein